MQDFVGVRGVMSPLRLRELSERSDFCGLVQLVSHLGAITLCTFVLAATWGTWWAIPFFVVQGVLLNFLYAAEHECYHTTAFRSPWLNVWVGRFCGFMVLYPSDYDKWRHFAHHRNTQDWDKDPELLGRKPFTSVGYYLLQLSGQPYFYSKVRDLLRQAAGYAPDWFLTDSQRRGVIKAARWHLVGYAIVVASAVITKSWWPLVFWIGPLLCTKWIYYLQGLQEHLNLTHERNTLLNTRTSQTIPIMRWLNWNMVYHTVHHTYPSVPFHALPTLQREVEAQFPHAIPKSGYLAFHSKTIRDLWEGRTELDVVGDMDAEFTKLDVTTAESKIPVTRI